MQLAVKRKGLVRKKYKAFCISSTPVVENIE